MAKPRTVRFGYYGDCPSCIAETRDHASMLWVAGWGGPGPSQTDKIIERAIIAAPIETVIMLPGMYVNGKLNPAALIAARKIFTGLQQAGVLDHVAAIYPQDEPNLVGLSDASVREANEALRGVMAEFVELDGTPLAVIYNTSPGRPGLSTYDWVGIDSYQLGTTILGRPLDDLKQSLRPDQRVLLVPGGVSPWEQDPSPFFAVADRDPQIIGIVAFLWHDNAAKGLGAGISSNGMAEPYRSMALLRQPVSP
jgi:hypothetical protein